jgi:hypothetical protein
MKRNAPSHYRSRTSVLVPALILLIGIPIGCGSDSDGSSTVDPRVEPLVMAVIDAYGGEEALRAIEGYHMKGIQRALQSGVTIQAERWFGRPDRLRLELDYPDHHETRYTVGPEGWVGSSGDDLRPANTAKLQAMLLQTARLDLPVRLLERLSEVEWRDSDDRQRQVLRLPISANLHVDYHIDSVSHRVVRVTMWMAGPPEMEFAAEYGMFHNIEGVLIPFHEVTYAGSSATSEFQVTEFEWTQSKNSPGKKPLTGAEI